MPRKSRGRLDMIGARIAQGRWLEQRRMQVLSKLPTFPKLMDCHTGFLPWVLAQDIKDARNKLADVLLWWCDRKCQCCGGNTQEEVLPCEACAWTGSARSRTRQTACASRSASPSLWLIRAPERFQL